MTYFAKDELGLNVAAVSLSTALLDFVWVFKPLYGFIADTFDICGSKLKSFLILWSLINSICWIVFYFWIENVYSGLLVKMVINIGMNFVTVIGDGQMVKYTQEFTAK